MKDKASKVGLMGATKNANPAKKYAGDMSHAEKGKAGALPQGGKMAAKKETEEESYKEESGIPKGIGAGQGLHSLPMNHLHEQDPMHEAGGFVASKTY